MSNEGFGMGSQFKLGGAFNHVHWGNGMVVSDSQTPANSGRGMGNVGVYASIDGHGFGSDNGSNGKGDGDGIGRPKQPEIWVR